MMHNAYVKVRPICRRCQNAFEWCFRVEQNVPDPLRCPPGGAPVGTGGGNGGGTDADLRCSVCDTPWAVGVSDLQRIVNEAIRRGWGEHVRNGAVVLQLPA